uniref:Transmembrane protein n=1 Tax=Fagus sylvatica TaxID=28930 RepID=A0A2N9HM22_FAGSY
MLAVVAVESRWSQWSRAVLDLSLSDSGEPRPRCFSLFVLFNDNIFNGKSGDPLDGCGAFGVDGCGLVVNLLWVLLGVWLTVGWGGLRWVYFTVVVVGFWSIRWCLAPRWVGMACRVACGGFLGGSRW